MAEVVAKKILEEGLVLETEEATIGDMSIRYFRGGEKFTGIMRWLLRHPLFGFEIDIEIMPDSVPRVIISLEKQGDGVIRAFMNEVRMEARTDRAVLTAVI